jgi:hypothetical protein
VDDVIIANGKTMVRVVYLYNTKCQYYYDYTDDELQTCVDERKIHFIGGSGIFIWHFFESIFESSDWQINNVRHQEW